MTRFHAAVALLVLGALASGRGDEPPSTRPTPQLGEALLQFLKLSPEERLRQVEKAVPGGKAFVRVRESDIALTRTGRGQREDADAVDVVCRVKAKPHGSTVATSVRSLIDDGTRVKKGDTLITLDDSALQDQLVTQKITVDGVKEDKAAAEGNLTIARKQNELD